jgi:hypothetical protein
VSAETVPFLMKAKLDLPRGYNGPCVYIISSEGSDLVKIGWGLDPKARLRMHQTGSPDRLRLIRLLPGGQKTERAFHVEFASQRVRGEWFSFLTEMMDYKPVVEDDATSDAALGEKNNAYAALARGFSLLEDIDKLKALGVYADETLESQQHLLMAAVAGHLRKAIQAVSELRGIGWAEAASVVEHLAPLAAEHITPLRETSFRRPADFDQTSTQALR